MKVISYLGLVAGLGLFGILLAWQGIGDVFQLLMASGWTLLFLPAVWLPNLLFATEAWRLLFIAERKPAFGHSLWAIWMGRAVNTLLPVATIGGEIVKARLLTHWGCRGTDASASVLVDKTVQVFAVIVWGLTGIGILFYLSIDNGLARSALTGFFLLAAGVAGFLMVQRAGMFSLLSQLGAKLIKSDSWEGITHNAREVDGLVLSIYRERKRFLYAVALKSLGLMVQTSEVWLACYLLGTPVTLIEAMMLKSLTATMGDVAFVVPNAYGIQEGAFMLVGALLGINPEQALALSLALRIREFMIDLPGLLVWQAAESRILLRRHGRTQTQ
ncbi:MAG: lysylphosphatidylglycerol synthase domain-containing protein [Gammaproteobacteria bacterium]